MSDPQSALGGVRYEGFAVIEEIGPLGMVTIRGDLADPALATALGRVLGLDLPAARRIVGAGGNLAGDGAAPAGAGQGAAGFALAWMSPDELMAILPYRAVADVVARLRDALGAAHFTVVDVSDARAVFRITGARAREVLAKLAPVDLHPGSFRAGEIRRTRLAQTAAAFWIDPSAAAPGGGESFMLVSFRSVAAYVFGLLETAARPGGEVGLFADIQG